MSVPLADRDEIGKAIDEVAGLVAEMTLVLRQYKLQRTSEFYAQTVASRLAAIDRLVRKP